MLGPLRRFIFTTDLWKCIIFNFDCLVNHVPYAVITFQHSGQIRIIASRIFEIWCSVKFSDYLHVYICRQQHIVVKWKYSFCKSVTPWKLKVQSARRCVTDRQWRVLKLCKYLVTSCPHISILLMIYNYYVMTHGIRMIRYMYCISLPNGCTEL